MINFGQAIKWRKMTTGDFFSQTYKPQILDIKNVAVILLLYYKKKTSQCVKIVQLDCKGKIKFIFELI